LPLLQNSSVGLIYADPPFNTKDKIGWRNRKYKGIGNDNLTEDDYRAFCSSWYQAAKLVTDRIVTTPGIAHLALYPPAIWCVAISKPSSCAFNRLGGFNCWEPLLVYGKPVQRIPRDLVVYDSKNFIKDGCHKHPCPDSLDMVKWIIATWSHPDELVLDPFLGSGTSAVAAKQLGRRFVGIEIEEGYCAIAKQRLSQECLSL